MILVVVSVVLVGIVLGGSGNGISEDGIGYGASLVSAVLSTLIYLGYFVVMESTQGRTVGKMVMKLHVEGASGGHPTAEESFKRNWWLALPILAVIPVAGGLIGALIELVVVILIAVQINSDPERRPQVSDRFADTRVIKEA